MCKSVGHLRVPVEVTLKTNVRSTRVGSRDVSEEEPLDLRDVHGLLDGRVPTADLKQAALQRVVAGHHGEENSHVVVPAAGRTQQVQSIGE